jgi:hypothetical protein
METLGLVILILLSGAALIAMLAVLGLLFPSVVGKSILKIEQSLGKAFLIGLVNALSCLGINALFLAWWQYSKPATAFWVIIWAVLMLLYLALLLPGLPALSALAQFVGSRMDASKTPLQCTLQGGFLLVLACLTPYIGWFLFTPMVLCIAIGSGLMTIFQRKQVKPAAEKIA